MAERPQPAQRRSSPLGLVVAFTAIAVVTGSSYRDLMPWYEMVAVAAVGVVGGVAAAFGALLVSRERVPLVVAGGWVLGAVVAGAVLGHPEWMLLWVGGFLLGMVLGGRWAGPLREAREARRP